MPVRAYSKIQYIYTHFKWEGNTFYSIIQQVKYQRFESNSDCLEV